MSMSFPLASCRVFWSRRSKIGRTDSPAAPKAPCLSSKPSLNPASTGHPGNALSSSALSKSRLKASVTATASVRFGEIGGPPRAHQLEMRASWTAEALDLTPHVLAFSRVLANVAGLPPEGVTRLG